MRTRALAETMASAPRPRLPLTLVAVLCGSAWYPAVLRADRADEPTSDPITLSIVVYQVLGDQADLDGITEGVSSDPLRALNAAGEVAVAGQFVGEVWLDEKSELAQILDVPWMRSLDDQTVQPGTFSVTMQTRGLALELSGTRAGVGEGSALLLDYHMDLATAPAASAEDAAAQQSRGQLNYRASGKTTLEPDKSTLIRMNRATRRDEKSDPDGSLVAAIVKIIEPPTEDASSRRKYTPNPATAARIETISAVVPRALFTPEVLATMRAERLPMKDLANRLERTGRVIGQSEVTFYTDLERRTDIRFNQESPLIPADGMWAPAKSAQKHMTDIALGTSVWTERAGKVFANVPVDLKTRADMHTPLKGSTKTMFPCPLSLRYKETARCQAGVAIYRIWSTPSLDGDTDNQTITISTLTMMPEKL